MKQNPKTVRMWMITCLLFSVGLATLENDRDFKMCGIWRHGNASRNLKYDLKTGCEKIEILANESTLSIRGRITAKCTRSSSIHLDSNALQNQSNFCVFWEPLLDLLIVEVNGKNHTLCEPKGLQGSCCTDLSLGDQKDASVYGIMNGSICGDIIRNDVMEIYTFQGGSINCKEKFCDEASQKPRGANMIEEVVMKSGTTGHVDLPCAQSTVIEMEEGFTGLNLTLPAQWIVAPNTIPSVYLPSSLKSISRIKSKVVCTYYKDLRLLQGGPSDSSLLDYVVGLSMENEIIQNLPEPVRIRFHHSALPSNYSKQCVSWDTRKDSEVTWRSEGCETVIISVTETECRCNHFAYVTVLMQVEQKATVRHLEALMFITAVGCTLSLVSCLVLFYWLCKRRGKKDQSLLVHRGLVVATFILCLCFSLTSTLANIGNETVCKITGTLLHYSLLSTLCWMTVEMCHTFLLVCCVFTSRLPPWVFYLAGFGIPAVPVCRLLSIGDIYGYRNIMTSEDATSLYFICWMVDSDRSRLSHFLINIGLLAVVLSSGAVMLFFVARNRPEWRKNRMAFLSIWGLTCLFGTTWGLFNFVLLTEVTLFLFCINACQGCFLMLRYYTLEWMKKRCELSLDGGSTGSVMLQCRDGVL
ncbi:adhesion G-protein coupled receptor G5-like [Rhinichthys klamathensis goyatoka]|uniref:adhesion G-protein coupled receptor G5-like n=1 Tax=Rhinichthys klamathensis goyatoka TaxID=3034132 RepID=UPI0024B51E16|nr:adhesion G-protein coupled receptor G5-like [Rhinichthys klamathensis goyatoka]